MEDFRNSPRPLTFREVELIYDRIGALESLVSALVTVIQSVDDIDVIQGAAEAWNIYQDTIVKSYNS